MTVKVHTLLDGTPVLTRWLEITNKTEKPLALMAVSPWAGRLWSPTDARRLPPRGIDHDFTLGILHPAGPGLRGLVRLEAFAGRETPSFRVSLGQGFDDPFFIVRNEARGEYFIGHLAWSANWHMEFECEKDGVLKFRTGPSAALPSASSAPERPFRPRPCIWATVEGDLDTAVQAMHDHLRRSVLPGRKPERAYLVQYSATGDQGYLANTFGDTAGMNEKNILATHRPGRRHRSGGLHHGCRLVGHPGGLGPLAQLAFRAGSSPSWITLTRKGCFSACTSKSSASTPGTWARISARARWPESTPTGWARAILDLTKPEVAAYVESELTRLIDRYKLDLYRLDYNPLPHQGRTLHAA